MEYCECVALCVPQNRNRTKVADMKDRSPEPCPSVFTFPKSWLEKVGDLARKTIWFDHADILNITSITP